MKLLIATDDLDLARALTAAVRSHGIVVEHCADPLDVLGRSWRTLPEVILVDLDLPLASGFTLMDRLRQDRYCRDVPVVATSAVLDPLSDEVAVCWEELGTEAFLPRPFSMLELPELLRELATSGWGGDVEDPLTLASEPSKASQRSAASAGRSRPVSFGELRSRRQDAQDQRRRSSLSEGAPLPARTQDPCRVSARDLRRELETLRRAPPEQVLGLPHRAAPGEIRQASLRKRRRLEQLRDDRTLVPELRDMAQRLWELVRSAEAVLLGQRV